MKRTVNSKQLAVSSKKERGVKDIGSSKILSILLILSLIVLLSGCASICEYDENGKLISRTDANGVLRTMVFKRTYYEGKDGKRGTLKEKTLSTESTSKDVFFGLNEILDTAANTAAKLKP